MKITELISVADELVENPFSSTVKLMLVNGIEGRVQQECFRIPQEEIEVYTAADLEDETELLLGPPFEQVYVSWMKSMYYWHMAEYESYENEHAMFDNEWNRLCKEVAERQCYGTSEGTGGTLALSTRPLAYRNIINQVTYKNSAWTSAMSFSELKTLIEKPVLPVCKVVDGGITYYMHLAEQHADYLVFVMNKQWRDTAEEFERYMLTIREDETVELLIDVT